MTIFKSRQHGFAAIAAIFLVVVLAALGGYMVTFSNTQQLTSAQDLRGTRAYWAARAGLEWGIAGISSSCPASPTSLAVDGFSVVITCAAQSFDEAGVSRQLFRLNSVASVPGESVGRIGFIERSVSASLER